MNDIKVTISAPQAQAGSTFDQAPDALRTLKPGDSVSLHQIDPGVRKLCVGAGWDIAGFESDAMDIDLSAFLLNAAGQTRVDEDFVFYNQEQTPEAAVIHKGDNRTGAGDGDDEKISIDLKTLPFDITTIMLVLSVYDGDIRGQYFRNTHNFFIRLENEERGVELVRLPLDELVTLEENLEATALIALQLERDISGWSVHAPATFSAGGLHKIAHAVGIDAV